MKLLFYKLSFYNFGGKFYKYDSTLFEQFSFCKFGNNWVPFTAKIKS